MAREYQAYVARQAIYDRLAREAVSHSRRNRCRSAITESARSSGPVLGPGSRVGQVDDRDGQRQRDLVPCEFGARGAEGLPLLGELGSVCCTKSWILTMLGWSTSRAYTSPVSIRPFSTTQRSNFQSLGN